MASYVDLLSIHNPATGTAPPATWGDQIRENETYLYERGPYICTAATRPGSPFEGQIIYETDTDKTLQYSGSAWWTIGLVTAAATGYTPGLVQGSSVTNTVTVSEWRIISGVCEWWFNLLVGAAGSAGQPVTIGLPVNASGTSRNIGGGTISDASAVTQDVGCWIIATTSTICMITETGTSGYWGTTPNLALGTSDVITGHVRYLVASAA